MDVLQIDHDLYRLSFPNLGILMTEFPSTTLDTLKRMCFDKLHDPNRVAYHYGLAGQIEHEYEFDEVRPLLDPILDRMMCQYLNPQVFLTPPMPSNTPMLKQYWINFQHKHEFNPLHMHSGLLSFVLWIDIPYDDEVEAQAAPGSPGKNSTDSWAGKFAFQYHDILGRSKMEPMPTEQLVGKLFLFPAQLQHIVYPFYSTDKPRISIAGNIMTEEEYHFIQKMAKEYYE